jgi:diaminopimelate epimerase
MQTEHKMDTDTVPFFKMSGSGNDFVVIDNREPRIPEDGLLEFVSRVCRRRLSVGADGLILIESSTRADFKWRFFNSDGSRADLCGNGARCAARFAWLNHIAESRMTFETEAGMIRAEIDQDRVRVSMPEPRDMRMDIALEVAGKSFAVDSIHTGVPHAVIVTEDSDELDVVALGRQIRFHPVFAPAGTNVNFIRLLAGERIAVRTYERGVEDETLACGTGSVASALVAAGRYDLSSPVHVLTRSGEELCVYFSRTPAGFGDLSLEGDARVIVSGTICPEAWS